MRQRTWKVIERGESAGDCRGKVELICENCGRDAWVETRGVGPVVTAVTGMALVFDRPDAKPPEGWLPTVIQCRKCGMVYSHKEKGV